MAKIDTWEAGTECVGKYNFPGSATHVSLILFNAHSDLYYCLATKWVLSNTLNPAALGVCWLLLGYGWMDWHVGSTRMCVCATVMQPCFTELWVYLDYKVAFHCLANCSLLCCQ